MKIATECGNIPALTIKEISLKTLSSIAFYDKDSRSRKGERGNFSELPRHIRDYAKVLLGNAFETYEILETDPLLEKDTKGGGTILFYGALRRVDFKPGDKVENVVSLMEGTVLAGEDGKLKEPCSEDKIMVRCVVQKGKNRGRHRDFYWNLENIKLIS